MSIESFTTTEVETSKYEPLPVQEPLPELPRALPELSPVYSDKDLQFTHDTFVHVSNEDLLSFFLKDKDNRYLGQEMINFIHKKAFSDLHNGVIDEFQFKKQEQRLMRIRELIAQSMRPIDAEALQQEALARAESNNDPNIFDAKKELRRIRQLKGPERKQQLKEFKEKFAEQQVGLAELQVELISIIRKYPDAPPTVLFEYVDDFAPRLGFTSEQKRLAKDALIEYAEKHKEVHEYRQQYPDDRKLFSVLFGFEPTGSVEIIEGPMTLNIRCTDPVDYTRLYKDKLDNSVILTPVDIESTQSSGGFFYPAYSLIPELRGTIIVEKNMSQRSLDNPESLRVLRHEEQHAIFSMLDSSMPQAKKIIDIADLKLGLKYAHHTLVYDAQATEEDVRTLKEILVVKYMRTYLRTMQKRGQDEILAYLRGGDNLDGVLRVLLLSRNQGGSYDYRVDTEVSLDEDFLNMSHRVLGSDRKMILDIVEENKARIFATEYQQSMTRAIAVVKKFQQAGYTTERIIATLDKVPLHRWPRLADHLLILRQ